MVISADAAYCYDRVNHIIMLLVWLVLTNDNIPAIVASLVPSNDVILSADRVW